MDEARVLTLKEAAEYTQRVIWMELLEMQGVIPVSFHSEHAPFLRFDGQDRVLMISVRGEFYEKTWRCWSARPDGQAVPDWKN